VRDAQNVVIAYSAILTKTPVLGMFLTFGQVNLMKPETRKVCLYVDQEHLDRVRGWIGAQKSVLVYEDPKGVGPRVFFPICKEAPAPKLGEHIPHEMAESAQVGLDYRLRWVVRNQWQIAATPEDPPLKQLHTDE
jgi:hypothetical protein